MLESLFILILLMGFVLFLIGILEKNIVFSVTSILMWLITMATHLYIEVPNVEAAYEEEVLVPLSLAFIFINLIWIIIMYMKQREDYRLP